MEREGEREVGVLAVCARCVGVFHIICYNTYNIIIRYR
jgi:hypothetical protein